MAKKTHTKKRRSLKTKKAGRATHAAHHVFYAGVALAFAVGVVSVPMATTALLRSSDESGRQFEQVEDQKARAIQDQAARRFRERQYWDATSVYYTLLEQGLVTEHSFDINKPETFMKYLDSEYINSLKRGDLHGSADQGKSDEVDAIELPALESERDLISNYLDRMGACPLSLKNHYAKRFNDLYDLCERMRKQQEAKPSTELRRSAPRAQTTDYQSLRKRLDLINDSLKNVRKAALEQGKPSTR